jgi:hypothetical protein
MFGDLIFYKQKKKMMARLSVPVTEGTRSLDFFNGFLQTDNGIVLNMGWDKMRIAVPFTE